MFIAVVTAAVKNMKKNSKKRTENDDKFIKEVETEVMNEVRTPSIWTTSGNSFELKSQKYTLTFDQKNIS